VGKTSLLSGVRIRNYISDSIGQRKTQDKMYTTQTDLFTFL